MSSNNDVQLAIVTYIKQYIKKNETILEDNARIIIKQLLTALSYLHYTCDICHRDIKPENIMFRDKNDINNLKLLDFGLSLDRFESKNYLENCGTLVYMAPELFSHNVKYTKGVDVWSVGIILYMLLMKGKNPFYNKEDKRETVIKNIKNNNEYKKNCIGGRFHFFLIFSQIQNCFSAMNINFLNPSKIERFNILT